MEATERERVRSRAEAAGLGLDEERFAELMSTLGALDAMMDAVRTIPVDPVDLAMTPFDPAWPEEESR